MHDLCSRSERGVRRAGVSRCPSEFHIVPHLSLPEGFALGGVHGNAAVLKYEFNIMATITDKTCFGIILDIKRL
jgi:hypothetical protein